MINIKRKKWISDKECIVFIEKIFSSIPYFGPAYSDEKVFKAFLRCISNNTIEIIEYDYCYNKQITDDISLPEYEKIKNDFKVKGKIDIERLRKSSVYLFYIDGEKIEVINNNDIFFENQNIICMCGNRKIDEVFEYISAYESDLEYVIFPYPDIKNEGTFKRNIFQFYRITVSDEGKNEIEKVVLERENRIRDMCLNNNIGMSE